mgnify:CR=1 FL=1
MTKMCLWSMGQEDEFYDEKLNKLKYGGGIWNILSSVMNVRDVAGVRCSCRRNRSSESWGVEEGCCVSRRISLRFWTLWIRYKTR